MHKIKTALIATVTATALSSVAFAGSTIHYYSFPNLNISTPKLKSPIALQSGQGCKLAVNGKTNAKTTPYIEVGGDGGFLIAGTSNSAKRGLYLSSNNSRRISVASTTPSTIKHFCVPNRLYYSANSEYGTNMVYIKNNGKPVYTFIS